MKSFTGMSSATRYQSGGCWPSATQRLLLQAALCDGESARSAWEKWRVAVDIAHLESASHRLLPLLDHNLTAWHIPIAEADKAIFTCIARETWLKNQVLMARGAALIYELEALGIATLVFKGAALAGQFYRDLSLRPMNDFDILVPSHQVMQAYKWALQNGWEFDVEPDDVPQSDVFLENLHGQGFRNAQGQSFDLHKHLLHHCNAPNADTDFWNASIETDIQGTTTRTLCATDHLLVALVHGVQWEANISLRWIADAMMILRASSDEIGHHEIDWNRVLEQTCQRRLHLPILHGLRYLETTFDAPIPQSVLDELARLFVTPAERLEFHGWTTSHLTHHPLMRFYLRYLQFARREISEGRRGKIFDLPLYLQHMWQLRSPWQLPFFIYQRGLRQLRAHWQARFRSHR